MLGFIGLATIVASFIAPWATIKFEYLSVDYTLFDLTTLMFNPNPVEAGGFKARLIISLFALAGSGAVDAVLAFEIHVTATFLSLLLAVVSVILDMKRGYALTLVCITLSSTLFVYAISRLYANLPSAVTLLSYSYDVGLLIYILNSITYAACILTPLKGRLAR
jgi:hypothetical protein